MKELFATVAVGVLCIGAAYNLAMLLVKAFWQLEKIQYRKRKK